MHLKKTPRAARTAKQINRHWHPQPCPPDLQLTSPVRLHRKTLPVTLINTQTELYPIFFFFFFPHHALFLSRLDARDFFLEKLTAIFFFFLEMKKVRARLHPLITFSVYGSCNCRKLSGSEEFFARDEILIALFAVAYETFLLS